MSEYQYYEFRAIDGPLTAKAMTALRRISARAEITPTSMQVEYNYGNFKGDPRSLVAKYFDAFVYVTNWGTRQLMLRLPRRVLDQKAVAPYLSRDALTARAVGEYVVVEFFSDDEDGGEWEEGEGWITALTGIRSELAAGDYRALYIGWLLGQRAEDYDEDHSDGEDDESGGAEPPVPPGLAKLTAPQRRLVEFLRVEKRAITAAAKRSAPAKKSAAGSLPTRAQMQSWVHALPATRKDQVLIRLLDGSDPFVGAQLQREFRTAVLAGPTRSNKARAGAMAMRRRRSLR